MQNQTQIHYAMPIRVMNEEAEDTYNLLAVMAKSPMLGTLKDGVKNEGGGWNMCKALDEKLLQENSLKSS